MTSDPAMMGLSATAELGPFRVRSEVQGWAPVSGTHILNPCYSADDKEFSWQGVGTNSPSLSVSQPSKGLWLCP